MMIYKTMSLFLTTLIFEQFVFTYILFFVEQMFTQSLQSSFLIISFNK